MIDLSSAFKFTADYNELGAGFSPRAKNWV